MSNTTVFFIIACAARLSTYADEGCQPGAFRFKEYCYTFIQYPQTFSKAEETCSGRGGHLAIIKDHNTARFIRALHKKMTVFSYWIGISYRNSEGIWRYISDNSTLLYENWNTGEPSDDEQIQDCAVMRTDLDLGWDDQCCCEKYLYICQFQGTSQHCQQNENKLEDNCYEFSQQRVKFPEAEQDCLNSGGKLAEINSMKEQRFLEERIQLDTWWKSLTDLEMDQYDDWSYGAWIGVHRVGGRWKYVDGSNVHVPHWRAGQPSTRHNADCVLVSEAWMSNTCDKLFSSICQFKAHRKSTLTVYDIQTTTSANVTSQSTLNVYNVQTTTPTNYSEFPVLAVSITIGTIAILIALFIGFIVMYHSLIKRTVQASMVTQPMHPPVPRRNTVHSSSFTESRTTSFYTTGEGYIIAQLPQYLQPVNDINNIYDDIIDDYTYASVNETRINYTVQCASP